MENSSIKANNSVNNQSYSHFNGTTTDGKTLAERFIENIDKMKNPHLRVGYETHEDYSEDQEQKDLKRYKSFINSSQYDDVKEVESEMGRKLSLNNLREIISFHDD